MYVRDVVVFSPDDVDGELAGEDCVRVQAVYDELVTSVGRL